MKFKNFVVSILIALLPGMIACNTVQPTVLPIQVSPTSAPVSPDAPLYQQVTLTAIASEADNQSPEYKITIQTPTLTGVDDPRVKAFNDQVVTLVTQYVDDFKNNLMPLPPTSSTDPGSSLDVQYQLLSAPGNILSIKFAILGYLSGAAHPYHFNPTFNFDLEAGKALSLPNLFLPNTDFLTPLSKYCVAELTTRDVGFVSGGFQQGADPKPDNYRNWNITPDGLMITFDEYQVASYDLGPQVVVVPYSELKDVINPSGALGQFIK